MHCLLNMLPWTTKHCGTLKQWLHQYPPAYNNSKFQNFIDRKCRGKRENGTVPNKSTPKTPPNSTTSLSLIVLHPFLNKSNATFYKYLDAILRLKPLSFLMSQHVNFVHWLDYTLVYGNWEVELINVVKWSRCPHRHF